MEAGKLDFPPDFDPLARDLVERLLVLNPEKRLGATGFHEIKSHPYFDPKCFEQSALLGRIFPSLQELCIRKVLKRFHALILEAMDNERQDRYAEEQAPRAKSASGEVTFSKRLESTDSDLKRADAVQDSNESHKNFSRSCSKDEELEQPKVPKNFDRSATGITLECSEQLLDQVLPRQMREQPMSEMSPHLQILVGRLEYVLQSQGRQFSKECTLADEWSRKHSRQLTPSDSGSDEDAQEGQDREGGAEK